MEINSHPLVSVIIPCYNNGMFIEECLNSVLNQDYPFLEVIVINDGSTDNSLNILSKYLNKIKVVTQKNSGAAHARNVGIKLATGKYITFLDGDDVFLERKIHFQVKALEKFPDHALCFSGYKRWNINANGGFSNLIGFQQAQEFHASPISGMWAYKELLLSKKNSFISTCTVMLRKSAIDETGFFDEDLEIGEDIDYWFRICKHYDLVELRGFYSLYRENSNSLTHKIYNINYHAMVFDRYINSDRSELLSIGITNEIISSHMHFLWFRYGYSCFWNNNRILAFSAFKKVIKIDIFRPKAYVYLLLSSCDFVYKVILNLKD